MTQEQFNFLFNKAKELMKNTKDPSHDWTHIDRVLVNALTIKTFLSKEARENIDERILLAAIAWHDISYVFHKAGIIQYFREAKRSVKIARKYFRKAGVSEEETNFVCEIILCHPFGDLAFLSKEFLNKKKHIYHQIVQDADSLDENEARFEKSGGKRSFLYRIFLRHILARFFRIKKKNIGIFMNLKESLSFKPQNF